MRIEFRDDDLRRLYEEPEFRIAQFGPDLVKQYRKKVAFLADANDERDLYAYKALHFETMAGARSHEHSIRLNDQWRLILELVTDDEGRLILIIAIEDYH
jgi:proteic killer suppression protein